MGLYRDGACGDSPLTTLSRQALCTLQPYFPELDTISYGEIKINFQPSYVDAPDGYYVDSGEKFKLHDNGYQYGWNTDLQAYARDRSGAGTIDSTLMLNGGNNWMISLPEGKYNVEIGYSDPANDIDTSRCQVDAVSISVGTVAAGETASTHINVEIENEVLYISGRYGSGCDSFSHIIVRSGWVESGYELGMPDTNECYAYQNRIETYEECLAAAQALGIMLESHSFTSPTEPRGCYQLGSEAFFNDHATGGVQQYRTPICERTHTLLIRQTYSSKVWGNELDFNVDDPDNDNYAILSTIEDYRSNDGRFYFELTWPQADEEVIMEWSQTSNPLTEDVTGYEAINIPYTGRGWGGLEPSGQALMDGSVIGNFKSNWFYAVGSNRPWEGAIPAYAKADNDYTYPQDQVELYVQKKTDVMCWEATYNKYLSGYPPSATTCNPDGCTYDEAIEYCDTLSDCGGVTLNKFGQYTVRKGTELKNSPTGETSWTKVLCEYTDRRQLERKDATLKNRLINLQELSLQKNKSSTQ